VHVTAAVEQQVPRFDVPVHDPGRVRGVECGGGLVEPSEDAPRRLCSLGLESVCERPALEVLHHDERPLVPLADVEQRDRAGRAGEPGRRKGLAR
jgi:hypothetical protein